MIQYAGNKQSEKGAVSIFIVIFTALLVTIVATSFIQLMLKTQQQASNNDLSQSAYDSAMAGVEDAKRALVVLEKCRQTNNPSCANIKNALNKSDDCESLGAAGVTSFNANGEVVVGNPEQNQAYTCVTVQLNTKSVVGDLQSDGDSSVIELRGTDEFSKVRVSWFSKKDIAEGQNATFFPTVDKLPQSIENWGQATPPIMRAQLIKFKSGNSELSSLANESLSLFMYPAESLDAVPDPTPFILSDVDKRYSPPQSRNSPKITYCALSHASVLYLCSADLLLPASLIGNDKLTFLQLTSIYGVTHYKVELVDGSTGTDVIVPFDSVQPVVDATGRASDMFRRVKANVSVGGLPGSFPNAALTTSGNLCKDFFVTDNVAGYKGDTSGNVCVP